MGKKIIAAVVAGVTTTSMMTIPAYSMDWRDGIKASHSYEYEYTDEGIASVYVKDKNGTVHGTVGVGEKVQSQTGTITWRDSYENVTAFYVDVKPGYEARVYVNGEKGNIYSAKDSYEVTVNSDLGNDSTYTVEANDAYDNVFYFSSAGKEAWVQNPRFTLNTEKITYTFVDESGIALGTAKVEEPVDVDLNSLDKEGYEITGYTVNGVFWDGKSQITNEMINASTNNQLVVKAQYKINQYTVTVNYYNDRVSGEPYKTENKTYDYNTVLDKEVLRLADNEFIVGANSVTVPANDIAVNVVTPDTDLDDYEWAFTYTGENDDHILEVVAQWAYDNSTDTTIQLNETVKLYTGFGKTNHIKFFILVDKGYSVKGLNQSNGEFEAKLTDSSNATYDVYEIEYKRQYNGELDNNPNHEYFSLETYIK